jgi:TetR/AcrR family transcriptional regulator, transcriptional repressor for nem operon
MNKAERTRQFIIEKAAPVFNQKGYAGTSLSDMTEATGLTKGSIYGNFADKDEVALACFDHNYGIVREQIRTEMAKYPSYRDKLLVYVEVYSNKPKYSLPVGGCPVLNTTVDADDTHPALRARAGEALTNWKERITSLVEAGKATGEFKAAVSAEQTALTIIAMLEGSIVIAKGTGKPGYAKAVIHSVEAIIRGL